MKLIPFSRGGNHNNKRTRSRHYTLRGFKDNGFAYQTIHVFSSKRSTVFGNGGKVWKEGGRRLDVERECEILWYVFFPCATRVLMLACRADRVVRTSLVVLHGIALSIPRPSNHSCRV